MPVLLLDRGIGTHQDYIMIVIVRLDRTIQFLNCLDSPIQSGNDALREMFSHKFVAHPKGI